MKLFGKLFFILLALVPVLALAGCAEYSDADPLKDCVRLCSDGKLEAVLVRDFSGGDYDETGLVSFVEEELAAFNSGDGADIVSLTGHSVKDGSVSVELKFSGSESFNRYMGSEVFYGSVQEAYDAGYNFSQALSKAGDPERIIGKQDLMNMADKRVFILKGDMRVTVPDDIEYYTQAMKAVDAKTVESQTTGTYFVLY